MQPKPPGSLIDELDEAIKHRLQNSGQMERESVMMEIFRYFVDAEGIYGKTNITPAQRNMIYVYELMHKKHPSWGLSAASIKLAQLLISQNGESRRGMIELFRGLLSQFRQESVSLEVGKQMNEPKK